MSLLVLLLVGCSDVAATSVEPTASSSALAPLGPLPLSIERSTYGELALRTVPGATCSVGVDVDGGIFGDGPPTTLTARADARGSLEVVYPAPIVPAGIGHHRVRCSAAGQVAEGAQDFLVLGRVADPRQFRVRIAALGVHADMSNIHAEIDPGLVRARDSALIRFRSDLPELWRTATRGLGRVEVVDSSADVAIYVIAGRGVREYQKAVDGTLRVELPVADERGKVSDADLASAALHELAHIWCCDGPGSDGHGHWLEKIADPQLGGVHRFGLMNSGADCARYLDGDAESCPTRFSERELRAMGFAEIPSPAPNACLVQRSALEEQIDALDLELDQRVSEITQLRTRLERLGGAPPRSRLVLAWATPAPTSSTDERRDRIESLIRAYNDQVTVRNDLSARLRALPPC